MKRVVAAALACALAAGCCLPLAPGAASVAAPLQAALDSKQRDIVLVMDTSGSMDGEPMRAAKQAATAFCESTLSKTSDTRIAVIEFADYAAVASDFSFDAAGPLQAIEGFLAGGGTNTDDALLAAAQMIEGGGRGGAIHSIVLMSDGNPNEYSYTGPDARYSSYEYGSDAHYASHVYNTAQTIQQHDIYTLGFFHSMSGQSLALGRQLLSDIQNKGYYDVVDPADLDFAFGDIAGAIVEANYPIIVLPGILASRLYMGNSLIWDGLGLNITLLRSATYLGMWNSLSVPKPENHNDPNAHKEYGVGDAYKNLMQGLCAEFPDREIYFFSYDWRQSCRDSAKRLAGFIETVKAPKVDLVCHSMGGLVASHYMAGLYMNPLDMQNASQFVMYDNTDSVNAIITLGTPYEGAPKTLVDMSGLSTVLGSRSFPGPGELTPTLDYLDSVGFVGRYYEFVKFSSFDEQINAVNGRGLADGDRYVPGDNGYYKAKFATLNRGGFESYCRDVFDESPNSYSNILTAQESIRSGSLGVLASLPRTYFMIGSGHPTIISLVFGSSSLMDPKPADLLESINDVGFSNQGDGIVPDRSATMLGGLEGIENAADRVRYYSGYSHEDLSGSDASKTATIQDICSILRSNGFVNGDINPVTGRPFIVVRVACPVDVEVSAGGQTLSSAADAGPDGTGAAEAGFGELYRMGESGDIKVFVLEDGVYDISMEGTSEGAMDYALRYFDGDSDLSREDSFQSVPIAGGTLISTAADIGGSTSLNIDFDGDGTTDSIWEADVNGVGAETWAAASEEDAGAGLFSAKYAAILIAVIAAAALAVALAAASSSRRLAPAARGGASAGAGPAPVRPLRPVPPAPKPFAPAAVVVMYGSMRGAEVILGDGEIVHIGRDAALSNIVLTENAEKVSRRHCAVSYVAAGDCYYVTDLSQNGTFLADMSRLPENTRVALNRGTTLCLADRGCSVLLR
ncbi:MAG: VWA domain-containing protein [Clostridiales Family XIII bacterium]|jgi:pimeloyl-ACP methyl ester carboxylesterase|nr:VWA domain-containing protein [Clostridiales Family XIII bacterium]